MKNIISNSRLKREQFKIGSSAAASWAWGTSLIMGQQTDKEEKVDHKARLMELLNESWRFESKAGRTVYVAVSRLLLKYGPTIREAEYKDLCQVVIAGDPKRRSLRAIEIRILQNK